MEQFKLMDNFKEEIVVKRNRTLDQILYGFCWISIVVFGLIALTSFYGIIGATGFNWVSLVIAVVFGGLAFLLWRNKDDGGMDLFRGNHANRDDYCCK